MISSLGLGGRQLVLQGYVDPAEGTRMDAGDPGHRPVLFMDTRGRELAEDVNRRGLVEDVRRRALFGEEL